jgi:hypothetical protein
MTCSNQTGLCEREDVWFTCLFVFIRHVHDRGLVPVHDAFRFHMTNRPLYMLVEEQVTSGHR